MYLELENITFKGMSNPEAFVIEEGTKSLEFQFLLRPRSEFANGCQVSTTEESNPGREEANQSEKSNFVSSEELQIQVKNTEDQDAAGAAAAAAPPPPPPVSAEEEDDGYQTPTSLTHKITTPRQCPPAPKKPRSLPVIKRKASSETDCIRIDLSAEEIELLFRPMLANSGRKIKKARKGSC